MKSVIFRFLSTFTPPLTRVFHSFRSIFWKKAHRHVRKIENCYVCGIIEFLGGIVEREGKKGRKNGNSEMGKRGDFREETGGMNSSLLSSREWSFEISSFVPNAVPLP